MLKSMALSPLAGVDGVGAARRRSSAKRAPGRDVAVSYPDYQYLRDHDRAFSGLFGSERGQRSTWAEADGARPVWAELVTGNYFQVLGVRAERGRTLLPSDEIAPGRHPVVVHQRRSLAARFRRRSGHRRQDGRDQQLPADGRRRGRSDVPRHDRGLRRRAVHPGDDGAAARLHVRQPADDAVSASSPTVARVSSYPQGYLRPGTTLAERRRADRRALGRRSRASGRSLMPRSS